MKIGFIYYTLYPVISGSSVHGYNLAKELTHLGYELYKLNGEPDPWTHKKKNPIIGLFWILKNCDIIYVRMDFFLNLRNMITILALLFNKKVIVELNSPADELYLFGRSERYIKIADKIMSRILKRVNAVIVINDIVKKYTEEALNLSNVHVIDNGGEVFQQTENEAGKSIIEAIDAIKKKFEKVVVWTGSGSKMHDFDRLKKIAKTLKNKAAILLVVKEEDVNIQDSELHNLFVFKNLSRNDVKHIVANSDVGLTFYSSFSWSRWGYYGSSTKTYEYLNNGLLTLTNIDGTSCQREYPNFVQVKDFSEVEEWIFKTWENEVGKKGLKVRTWKDVAEETSQLIKKI